MGLSKVSHDQKHARNKIVDETLPNIPENNKEPRTPNTQRL